MQQLTIQLVTWNSAAVLRRSLPTLRQVDPSIALIRIIDNASIDESLRLVEAALPSADVVRLPANTGFAGGHNEGFRRCTTPFVLIVNPDVELAWAGVIALLEEMQDPTIGALQGKLYRQGKVIDSAGVIITAAFNGRERGAGEIDRGQYNEARPIDAVTGACALYRLAALRAIAHPNGEIFDADFWAYKEDVDVSWRLRRAGWKLLYVPVTAGRHERSLKTESRLGWPASVAGIRRRLRDPRARYSSRNWIWLMLKNATPAEALLHSPWIAARLAVLLSLTALYWPAGRAWSEAAAGIPKMIAKRRISH